ncbi:MAG TPA: ABC transporter permease [Cyclobacteriaceae bacterium]|nr:ABC transporter permease [Cyclobacteriaceae bacterium]
MSKILLIAQREFKNRVQKKSFVIATILLPLIFPAIMGTLIYFFIEQEKNEKKEIIHYLDESHLFDATSSNYIFLKLTGDLEEAKKTFSNDDSFGLLYIPPLNLYEPKGITLYTKVNPSPADLSNLEKMIEGQFRDLKMKELKVNKKILDSLNTDISIGTITISNTGREETSHTGVLFGVGMTCGILMYMFILIYGMQIMQGIIEEKMSRVVEVIVSSVKPFQLMMGKILGLASVGLLQFLIWIVLITTLSTAIFALFGIELPQQEMMNQMGQGNAPAGGVPEGLRLLSQIPFTYIIFSFLFYFVGGYLLYGALFAAVGSSVDSPAEAQQFTFPITIPMLISYLSLFTFILNDPHGSISVWLSIIPFTSPIAMIGRIAFGVPFWQLALSMICLIGGFIFTTWIAARIYRVGILMHGTKVNYKVLAKWFMMKN